ncbi:MAG: DUF3868 domain-containing protein [Muribaculaceae bacterium]|nr:DUF3868 domain-containing protein [Muribaculaceae bacterium]
MKNSYTIAILFAALAAVTPAAARQAATTLPDLKVLDLEIYRSGDNLHLSFNLDLSGVTLGSDEQVIYTPVLAGATDSVVMDPVVLNGRNAQLKWEREPGRRKAATGVYRRFNGTYQAVNVAYDFPYLPWMDLSQVTVAEDLCGCGRLRDQNSILVGEFDNTPLTETFEMTYITPAKETTKSRALEGSAYVEFVVSKTNILPDYRNNAAEIRRITETIDVVKDDPTVTISEINIHGFASPEGSYSLNTRLAAGRAASLKDYVRSLYTLDNSIFTSDSTPEDWDGLRRLVEASALQDKEAILALIDSDLDPDVKDSRLRSLYPEDYAVMLSSMYPSLRRSDYVVKYVVRPYTVEETAEIMKVNPRNVSLEEMFLVAKTYDPASPEFYEAMTIAAATYPDSEIANLNAANAALTAGDLDAADSYLRHAGQSPEAVQARGVLALQCGDLDLAELLLTEALQAGVPEAARNLELLARARVLARQNR